MLLTPTTLAAIDHAVEIAAAAFQILATRDWPLTFYEIHESGRRWEETPKADGLDVEQQKKAWLQINMPGTLVKLMVDSRTVATPDSFCTHALYIEFGKVPLALFGLTLVLPYAYTKKGTGLITGMVQVRRYPETAFYLLDEILPAFVTRLRKSCHEHWVRPLEYDRKVKPSQVKFESESLPVAALCPSIAALTGAASSSNDIASRYLDALIERYPFEGGIAFQKALYQLQLDFSVSSLLRVDYLLNELKSSLPIGETDFLERTANMNFLLCVAIYCGKVIAKAAGTQVDWYTYPQFSLRFPGQLKVPSGPATSLIAVFNASGGQSGHVFFPVQIILQHLFGKGRGHQLRDVFKAWGQAAQEHRVRQINDEMPVIQRMINALPLHQQDFLTIQRIAWFEGKYFDQWFQKYSKLYHGGRLVWGCIVQAHNDLYTDGKSDRLAEIIFDPRGLLSPQQLNEVALKLMSYKGCRPIDARLSFLADAITDEGACILGMKIPYRLSSDDLCTSVLVLTRKHLPGGCLFSSYLPILIHDDVPGIAIALPSYFWTPAIARECAAYGWPVQKTASVEKN
ncbi:hypothetical protein ACO0K9_21420 [Undibacterium sp. Ji50W]|uniref:hypothetical protein n=1 Tax=Undibacterium sp. Ji50W TaxID=3413041 RepID=UPI003BF22E67